MDATVVSKIGGHLPGADDTHGGVPWHRA